MMGLFKRKPDLRFVPAWGRPDVGTPIISARAAPRAGWLKRQEAAPPVKLAHCPGMWDYLQAGYIIPAWCDIHVKANKAGVSVRMDGANTAPGHDAVPMDFALVDGMAPIADSVKRCVVKIPVPWSVFAKSGISCQVLPATMHSPFLDKLYVYPGVVDYDQFHTINFIFSALGDCEFTIWAGTPLLQVIPFRREAFSAECGPATAREEAVKTYGFFSRRPGFYRRAFHGVKKYSLTVDSSG